jgi:hypothetical protein
VGGKTEGDDVASSSRFLPSLFLLNKIPKKDGIKEKRENPEMLNLILRNPFLSYPL